MSYLCSYIFFEEQTPKWNDYWEEFIDSFWNEFPEEKAYFLFSLEDENCLKPKRVTLQNKDPSSKNNLKEIIASEKYFSFEIGPLVFTEGHHYFDLIDFDDTPRKKGYHISKAKEEAKREEERLFTEAKDHFRKILSIMISGVQTFPADTFDDPKRLKKARSDLHYLIKAYEHLFKSVSPKMIITLSETISFLGYEKLAEMIIFFSSLSDNGQVQRDIKPWDGYPILLLFGLEKKYLSDELFELLYEYKVESETKDWVIMRYDEELPYTLW